MAVGLVVGSSLSFVGESFVGANDAAPPSGIVLAADAGSYSVAGQAATLRVTRRVVAAAAAYVLAGQAANLEKGFEVVAAAGSYSVAGQAANLERGRAVDANVGRIVAALGKGGSPTTRS